MLLAAAAADLPAPFWCFQMCSFCAKLALLSCHARNALGLRSCHILVFSYHIILVRIAFFSTPVMCEAGLPVNRLKVGARLGRIRSFFAALSSLISSDNNDNECSFAPARISLFSKFATVGTGHYESQKPTRVDRIWLAILLTINYFYQ